MSRSPIVVSPVTPEHHDDLVGLWLAARVEAGASLDAATRYASDGKLAVALRRPEMHAYVAHRDGEPVGYILLVERMFGFAEHVDLAIDQLFVVSTARRQGVAKQLLSATVTVAEKLDCERVISNVPTGQRDANRFFARLGFGSVITRRVTTTAALRRKVLGGADVSTFEQVLRRRRSARMSGRTRSA